MTHTTEPGADELGAQIGQALHRRVASQGVRPIGLDPVLAGVSRRQARRRGGVIVVCIAVIAAAGVALATRADESVVGDNRAPLDRPAMLPAYALLDGGAPGVGQPVYMYAYRGGVPMGIAVPQIDVWASGDQRLVIRSVDNSVVPQSPAVTTTVVATTAATATGSNQPWGQRLVSPLQIRGVDGAVQEFSPDQFAVWLPTSSPDRYTIVIARGMSKVDALTDVAGLVEVAGVLQPARGFTPIERAASLPATTPSPAGAGAEYSFFAGPFLGTYSPLGGRSSIETIGWTSVGRVESINGREVMFDDNPNDGSNSATWLDPTGVVNTITVRGSDVAKLVPFIHNVNEADWLRQSTALSARIASDLPAADRVSIGDTSLIRRGSDNKAALCLALGATEACVSDTSNDSPISVANQVEIDGHWLIFGYREILPEEEKTPSPDDLKFISAGGSCCKVDSATHDGAVWFVVHVDDGVNVIDTNIGNVFGGVVGSISRPLVASNIQ
jgi:hypothetical protein